jgi:outer membrane lipoprotein-sorting protein
MGSVRRLAVLTTMMSGVALLGAGPASAQTLDEIIAKNLSARGGVEKLRSLETVKGVGVMEARGVEIPIATWAKRPNKMRRDQKLPDRSISVAFDGIAVWMLDSSLGTAQKMTGPQADSTRDEATFDPLILTNKDRGHRIDLVGNETLDGVAVHHLRVTKKNGPVEDLYLKAETGLELRTVTMMEQAGTKAELRTDFSDYRAVDGMQVPFSIRQFMNGNQVVQVRLTEYEFNVPIDDGIFSMPK